MNENILCSQIAALRKEAGMTQEQLATRLGVSFQAVSKWENGLSCPDIMLLPELAELFRVSIDSLFGREAQGIVPTAPLYENELPWPEDGDLRLVLYKGRQLLNATTNKGLRFTYTGPALNVSSAVDLTCEQCVIRGNVSAGGCVDCGAVGGSVSAAGDVSCTTVGGGVEAQGDVDCNSIGGGVDAGGDVSCTQIYGSVSAGGDIDCGTVWGNVSAGGDVSCDKVNGSVTAGGDADYSPGRWGKTSKPNGAQSAIHCIQCGAELAAGTVFCTSCGARQDDSGPTWGPDVDIDIDMADLPGLGPKISQTVRDAIAQGMKKRKKQEKDGR